MIENHKNIPNFLAKATSSLFFLLKSYSHWQTTLYVPFKLIWVSSVSSLMHLIPIWTSLSIMEQYTSSTRTPVSVWISFFLWEKEGEIIWYYGWQLFGCSREKYLEFIINTIMWIILGRRQSHWERESSYLNEDSFQKPSRDSSNIGSDDLELQWFKNFTEFNHWICSFAAGHAHYYCSVPHVCYTKLQFITGPSLQNL